MIISKHDEAVNWLNCPLITYINKNQLPRSYLSCIALLNLLLVFRIFFTHIFLTLANLITSPNNALDYVGHPSQNEAKNVANPPLLNVSENVGTHFYIKSLKIIV